MGVPGVLRRGESGDLEWQMTEPPPEPVDRGPAWARSLAADLAEIKRLLQSSNGPALGRVTAVIHRSVDGVETVFDPEEITIVREAT